MGKSYFSVHLIEVFMHMLSKAVSSVGVMCYLLLENFLVLYVVLRGVFINCELITHLGPVFPLPIKSNLIFDLLVSDQLDVLN